MPPTRVKLSCCGAFGEGYVVALDAAVGQAHAGHDAVAVNIEPGTAGIQDLHHRLLVCGAGAEPRWWQSRVRAPTLAGVATMRGAQGLRVKLIHGLAAPLTNRPRCRRRPHHTPVSSSAGRAPRGGKLIRIPGEGLGLDSCAVAKRVGWCAMSRGGRPWRELLVI